VSEKAIKLQAKEARTQVFFITVPSDFVKDLNLKKGDILHARILEVEIEPGKKVKGIFYYKP